MLIINVLHYVIFKRALVQQFNQMSMMLSHNEHQMTTHTKLILMNNWIYQCIHNQYTWILTPSVFPLAFRSFILSRILLNSPQALLCISKSFVMSRSFTLFSSSKNNVLALCKQIVNKCFWCRFLFKDLNILTQTISVTFSWIQAFLTLYLHNKTR